jgi:hypothetical protein
MEWECFNSQRFKKKGTIEVSSSDMAQLLLHDLSIKFMYGRIRVTNRLLW